MQGTSELKSNIIIENREKISISGVTDVVEFDDSGIMLRTEAGNLIVEGSGIQISVLDVESGRLEAVGKIDSASYSDRETPKKKGLFSRFAK
ncbi:MAG: sporulation protein YabP [Clostridia bacterium]|nr:sporulation protein YabP [Clostridia bacterium]